MAKEIESISVALFDKVRSRFANVTLGDENAKAVHDPEKARFFNFTYTSSDGAEHGAVTISLIDETSLKIYYGSNVTGDMDRDQRQEWYDFLRNIRKFAKRNLLTFDTRDINKSNLDLKDIKQQTKADTVATTDEMPVTESRINYTGSSRHSYARVGECKLIIRHSGQVDETIKGSRTRHIEEIFVETARGERFLMDHTNLSGAVAMAHHLNEGGTIFDERAGEINRMVSEMNSMRHFVRSVKRREFEDAETQELVHTALQHYGKLKNTLRQMRGARGFRQYFGHHHTESFDNELSEEEMSAARERFVKKIYDSRFDEALPIVLREYERNKNSLGNELEEWANEVTESTWAKPDNEDKITALRELLKTPMPVGIDGIDAIAKIEPIIGSDELNDTIEDMAVSNGPDADARTLIKQWLVQYMPGLLNSLEIGQKNSQDAQTNWAQPVSPQISHNDEFGSSPASPNVNNMTMENTELSFIRTLAGI